MSPTSYQTAPPRVARKQHSSGDPPLSRAPQLPSGSMRWFRRRRAGHALEPVRAAAVEVAVVPRLERLLIAYAAQAHRVDLRVERLEERLQAVAEAADGLPSHARLLGGRPPPARGPADLA